MLQIVVVDDDIDNNQVVINELLAISKGNQTRVITELNECHSFMNSNVHLVIISVCSPQINYISFIEEIKLKNSKSVICLAGNNDAQSVNVYIQNCDLYIKKPYSISEIHKLYETALLLSKRMKRLYINTFGRFDVLLDGSTIHFHNAKAKELLALCVDHCGGDVTMPEAIDKLWPNRCYDEKVKRLYRKAVISIHECFEENHIDGIFESSRGVCCINADEFECDYYLFLSNPHLYSDMFNGMYMFEYEWAENTLIQIEKMINKETDDEFE